MKKTQPPIDEDQKLALLHALFAGTSLFGGDLAKLHEANTKSVNAVTVYPATAPPASYPRPYVDLGKSFNYSDRKGGYSRRGGGRGRGQGRSTPSATNTNTKSDNSKSNERLTVSQSPISKKSEPNDDNSRKNKRNFPGKGQGNKKQ